MESSPPENLTGAGASLEPPPSFSGPKIRLMCSYGGHIVPRPLDKTLCYAGGDTRIIAVDRRSAYSLSSLTNHLSKTLLNGRPFILKYQLPDHDLDSLISISTDEDLANMIDEYDRISSSSSYTTPSRIRFFLFPSRSRDLHDPKSEDWFIDALRNAGVVGKVEGESDSKVGSADSIVFEKSSSFGSTGSSASASNSPAVISAGGEEGVGVLLHDFKVALPSVDSMGSDSSISQQAIVYHDALGFPDSKSVSANHVETESSTSDRSPLNDLLTPVQVSNYILSKPMDQPSLQAPPRPPPSSALPPPYFHHPVPLSNYVTQYYPSSVTFASYPTMYPPYVQPQQPVQYQLNKPPPVYMMPVGQTQNPFDMHVPCALTTAQIVAPSQPQVSPNPVMVASSLVYEGPKPTPITPEYSAKVSSATAAPVQPMPSDDHTHNEVVAFPPMNPPPQPVSVPPPVKNTSYNDEYEDPMRAQIYKTQPPGPTLPSQLQTATNAATVMLSESFSQLQVDNAKH